MAVVAVAVSTAVLCSAFVVPTSSDIHAKRAVQNWKTTTRQLHGESGISSKRSSPPLPHQQIALLASLSSISDKASTSSEDDGDSKGEDKSGGSDGSVLANSSRLRRLKDVMWVREAREDLTAAEFACSVEAIEQDAAVGRGSARSGRRKRAVDYEKLLTQLNNRVREMGCDGQPRKDTPFACALTPGKGMGSIAYTDRQREALLERILRTRQMLIEVMRGHELYDEEDLPPPFLQLELPELRVEIPKENDPTSPGPKLYVRDDGTVDWDGALQDREALRKFGTAVWARINGRDPESLNEDDDDDDDDDAAEGGSAPTKTGKESGAGTHAQRHSAPRVVTAKIEETTEIKQAREELNTLSKKLQEMERSHVALLNSAISAGQAVANVNLASLQPAQRIRIIESAEALEKMKEQVSFHTLIYELERIYSYLIGELGNPALTGYIPLQDRLNVAEFGLLESQIESFNRQISEGDSVDADVLAVVMEQLTDFKRRLGIDYYVTGVSFDGDGIRRWLGELLEKTKKGLAFYVKGVRLFWNDIIFCLSLINRAAQGYTLKPREVRFLRYDNCFCEVRRTIHEFECFVSHLDCFQYLSSFMYRRSTKDIITFIPVVIILLIPLSPVGHVLVFGAIQRFFPDFFPSCFTEQRQNLLQLYENAEYSEFSINENWKVRFVFTSSCYHCFTPLVDYYIHSNLTGLSFLTP